MYINNNHSSNSNRTTNNTSEESKIQNNQAQKRLFPFSNSDLENPNKEIKLITKEAIYKQLETVIQSGNSQALSDLLSRCKEPININYMIDNGDTLLHIACKNGSTDIIKILFKYGKDKCIRNKNGYTPLELAAINNRKDIIILYVYVSDNKMQAVDRLIDFLKEEDDKLKEYELINYSLSESASQQYNSKRTLINNVLQYVENIKSQIVQIQNKIQDMTFNEIFLIILCRGGSLNSVECIHEIKQNKNVTLANIKKKIVTITNNKYINLVINDLIIKDLIDNLNLENLTDYIYEKFNINSILHNDLYNILLNSSSSGRSNKQSILEYAASINNMQLIRFVLNSVSIEKKDIVSINKILSDSVSENRRHELCEFLLQYPKIDKEDMLYIACENNQTNLVRILIERYPNLINEKTDDGYLALYLACENGHIAVASMLIDKYPYLVNEKYRDDYTVLHIACESDHIAVASMLVDKFPNLIYQIDNEGNTPLHTACHNFSIDVANMLIKKDSDLVNMRNSNGSTILDLACGHPEYKDYTKVAEMLIEKYPDLINQIDNYGNSPLHTACYYIDESIVSMLIEKAPNLVNKINDDGHTPLHAACERYYIGIIKILITHQTDINIRTKDNETCLDIISDNDQLDDDEKETLLEDIIDFTLIENTIAIESENYLFLSPDTVNKYSEYISPNLRIIFKTLIDKIQNKALIIDKPIYMIHKVVEFDNVSKNRANFIENINNIEKVINNFIMKQFNSVNNAMIVNSFTLMLTCLTTQDKQEIDRQYNRSNKSFTMSWLESGETFILKIDNINLSFPTKLISNNNFKDIKFTFNH